MAIFFWLPFCAATCNIKRLRLLSFLRSHFWLYWRLSPYPSGFRSDPQSLQIPLSLTIYSATEGYILTFLHTIVVLQLEPRQGSFGLFSKLASFSTYPIFVNFFYITIKNP